MTAKTPPTEYLSEWGATFPATVGRISPLSVAKQREGYNISEAPGSAHLNYIYNRIGDWNEVAGRAAAAKMAFRNIDYTDVNPGPTTGIVQGIHIDYFENADHWYISGVDVGGNVFCNDSADGETWATVVNLVNVGAGSYGDASKVATDGTVCAIAADVGGEGVVYTSSDLTVANLGGANAVDTATNFPESSDMVYDGSLWIFCGRSTTRGNIWTASNPAGTWTLRKTFTTDADAISLSTDGAGNSVCSGATETFYSSNGTTWNTSTTVAPVANNSAWSPSLGLFVIIENATGEFWTSTNGDVWRDQFLINAVPKLYQLAHTPDFFLAWESTAVSANGATFAAVHAFHTEAINADDYSYQPLGDGWEDALPKVGADFGIFRGGQGKVIFPYHVGTTTSNFKLAIARYGAA